MRVWVTMDQAAIQSVTEEASRRSTRRLAETTARRTRENIMRAGRVRTGRMLRSVDVRADEDGYSVGSDVPYFPHQEGGTRRGIAPMHALRDAVSSLSERDLR